MAELASIQCPCGTVFQTLWELVLCDEDGNARCDNCAVEMGLKEDLDAEPSDAPIEPMPEGADAIEETAQEAEEAPKIDGRTKAAREAKRAAGAA